MKYTTCLIAIVLTGCGTVQEKSLEYCDTTKNTFIGFPVWTDAQCTGISNSDNGSGVIPPGTTIPQ